MLVDRLAFTSDNELNGRGNLQPTLAPWTRSDFVTVCSARGSQGVKSCRAQPWLMDRDWIEGFLGPRNFPLTSSRSKGPGLSTLPGEPRLPDAAQVMAAAQAMAHVWNDKYGRFYDRTYRVMYDAGINETGGRTGNTSHVSCGVDVV